MFKKIAGLKLKQRLNAGYLIVIMFMALSGLIAIIGFITVKLSVDSYINVGQRADTAVKMCRVDVNIAARNIREMALNTDSAT